MQHCYNMNGNLSLNNEDFAEICYFVNQKRYFSRRQVSQSVGCSLHTRSCSIITNMERT